MEKYKLLGPALETYDEWMYILTLNLLEGKTGLQNPLEFLIASLHPTWFSRDSLISNKLSSSVRTLLEYVFTLLQNTVDKKIHYSVILEIETTFLDKDDFYGSNKRPDLAGLRLTMLDALFIIRLYQEAVDAFMLQPPAAEATDRLLLIHSLLKLLIPVSFLGGYNQQAQQLFFPQTLDRTARLLHFVQNHYYAPKVPLLEDAAFELNTNCLRVLGNIVHVNKPAQDYLLDQQLLKPLLRYLGPDKMNPLSREASIVFIKYLTESNQRAAEFIRSLEVYEFDSASDKLYSHVKLI